MDHKKTFDQLGGQGMIEKISKIFYDKIYEHPWIGQYFKHIDQEIIEEQQTHFMMSALGGPKIYCGALPVPAHKHMYISEELYDLRTELLMQAMKEAGACEDLVYRWKNIDQAFKHGLVKDSLEKCEKRFNTDEILNFPDPKKKAA